MADTKVSALTVENIDPLGSDLEYLVDDPSGTPAPNKVYSGSKNLLPDGFMINGKLSVTVATNDLTVALKTRSGGDPSSTDPVSIWINGTYRRITAATSFTILDGTNYFSSGSAVTAGLVVPYFVYAVWDSNSSIVALSCARISHGRLVSDFSATTTSDRHLYNYANFTSTDDVQNIGYFEATLSAGAAYTWSVPAFTSLNLIHAPTYVSRWMTFAPAPTGFSAAPANASYVYQIGDRQACVSYSDNSTGTSNGTGFTVSAPISCSTRTNGQWGTTLFAAYDNGVAKTTACRAYIVATTPSTITLNSDMANGTWTAANGKAAAFFMAYEL